MCEERKENYDFDFDDCGCLKKFDICLADLGDIEEDDCTLRKVRPVVILQSDNLNNEKTGTYIVAGIKTEYNKEVKSREDAEKIVEMKRKYGRIYVPIRRRSSDRYITFIEITQLRMLPANMVHRYLGRINNQELKDRINRALMELMFNDEELCFSKPIEVVEEVQTKEPEVQIVEKPKRQGKKPGRKSSFPQGISRYVELYMKGELAVSEIAKKLDMKPQSAYYYIKRYKELHPELVKKYK